VDLFIVVCRKIRQSLRDGETDLEEVEEILRDVLAEDLCNANSFAIKQDFPDYNPEMANKKRQEIRKTRINDLKRLKRYKREHKGYIEYAKAMDKEFNTSIFEDTLVKRSEIWLPFLSYADIEIAIVVEDVVRESKLSKNK